MNKKILFGIILVLTSLAIIFVLIFNFSNRYDKFVMEADKWNDIVSNRNRSTSIVLENIKFNDYNLLVDEENSVIYYSVVNGSKKYNPSVEFTINGDFKIAFNDKMTDDVLEQSDKIKIMLYNDKSYRIYTLVITNYPILNMTYKGFENAKRVVSVYLELFDNHVRSPRRLLKSEGKLKVIEDNQEYSFSLIKESLGRNRRENHVSIFGMEKRDEYIIRKVSSIDSHEKLVQVFINNKYSGLYSLGFDERSLRRVEENR